MKALKCLDGAIRIFHHDCITVAYEVEKVNYKDMNETTEDELDCQERFDGRQETIVIESTDEAGMSTACDAFDSLEYL